MKILFLSDDFPPQSFGGAGISTYELAIGMQSAGHEVFVITTCRDLNEEGEITLNGIKVFKIASNYPEKWRAYLGLYNRPVVNKVEQLLKKIHPDITHVNNIHYHLSYYCLRIAKTYPGVVFFTARDVMSFSYGKLRTKKYLDHLDCRLTWRDQLTQAGKRWNPFRNFFIRKYLKNADKIFAVSSALKDALAQNGIPGATVIHTGISVDDWKVEKSEIEKFKLKYGLVGKKVIFFGGRVSDSKGAAKITEAMGIVTKEIPGAILFVAGGVNWISREEMKFAYACSDVVVVPSICFDSFPRTVLEAMACGRPVIASKFGGASEAVVDNVTGYVVDPRDTGELARRIMELLKNSEKAKQFGAAGLERIKESFSQKVKVQEMFDIYGKIINIKK
jgi:glycosyltransferase involved in cell wall biosynthesis